MKVTIISVGSRGDVEPLLGLASALKCAGHSVRFATNMNYRTVIEEQGVDFFPVAPSCLDIHGSPAGLRYQSQGANPITYFNSLFEMWADSIDGLFNNCWTACQGSDVILGSNLVLGGGYDIARKLGVPFVLTAFFPVIPTSSFPSYFVPPWLGFSKSLNKLSHHLIGALFWSHIKGPLNKWRREKLDEPSSQGPNFKDIVCLMGYSKHVSARPPDWPDNVELTGFWFLESSSEYEPPTELAAFIDAGEVPVCVGFGSIIQKEQERTAELVVSALQKSGQRGILLSGWGGLKPSNLPANVFAIDSVPHEWLFPRVSSIVHAGGAGTTGAVARAGKPSLVVPFTGDQFFWGERLFRLGSAAKPIPYRNLTADKLAKALDLLRIDSRVRASSAELGEKIRSENGVSKAIEILDDRFFQGQGQ